MLDIVRHPAARPLDRAGQPALPRDAAERTAAADKPPRCAAAATERRGPDALTPVLARAVGARRGVALLQRHAGKATAEDLLKATRGSSTPAPGFARRLCDGPKLPDVLTTIWQVIENDSAPVREIVLEALYEHMTPRQSLALANPGAPNAERVLRNWASGEGAYAFDLPLAGLHDFMAQLFVLITQHHPSTAINELDLFHGHVVPTESPRDLVVLFHAKELPQEMVSSHQQVMWKDAGVLNPRTPTFSRTEVAMRERNFLWALSTNSLWLLTDPGRTGPGADARFATLIAPEGQMSELGAQQKVFGTVTESSFGQDLMNVNYFPGQLSGQGTGTAAEQQLFFTPVGAWGVMMALHKMFPVATREEVEATYADAGESLAKCRRILATFVELVDLGFDRRRARAASVSADGDLDQAAELAVAVATTV